MADNVGYTPGSGATVAADDIGGILYQRVKPVTGDDGTATDVSATNPMPVAAYGELIEAIESMRMSINVLANIISRLYVDGSNSLKVISATGSTVSVSNTLNVSSVSTLSSLLSLSGKVNSEQLFTEMHAANALDLRKNISVS